MVYGYIRVSSINQNIDRQYEDLLNYGINKNNLFIDRISGKDFQRDNYQRLIKKLKKNDLLVIKSIDRLGRNYEMIIEEWTKITKIIGADILVLDMPLLDTRQKQANLIGKFISDIVLQVLSFVAQNERELIKQRQAEGIALAKLKGVHLGRPSLPLPINFKDIAILYINKKITNTTARERLVMTKGTFFRNIKILKEKILFI